MSCQISFWDQAFSHVFQGNLKIVWLAPASPFFNSLNFSGQKEGYFFAHSNGSNLSTKIINVANFCFLKFCHFFILCLLYYYYCLFSLFYALISPVQYKCIHWCFCVLYSFPYNHVTNFLRTCCKMLLWKLFLNHTFENVFKSHITLNDDLYAPL